MKLSVLLTCILSVNLMASVYSQNAKFDLDVKDQTVREILKTLEKESLFRFFYNDEFTDLNKKLTFTATDRSIDDLMSLVLDNTEVSYKILDNNFIVITPKSLLQQRQVTGNVTDENGNPLPGVNVQVEGTTIGAISDAGGKYSIDIPNDNAILVFSFIGYNTQKISASGKTTINMTLIPGVASLEEVVVIGYGTQKKVTVTGSVASVEGSEIVKSKSPNVVNSLIGQLPGVIINNRSGEPGKDNPSIFIRGRSTTGDASPLIIIDGIERGGLGRINPNDVESVTVLKDASAAIYGARAANGVILVTTKRGAVGKPTIELSFNQGFTQSTRNPIMADSYTFAKVYNEIEVAEGRPLRYTETELQKFKNGTDPDNYPNTDWYDYVSKDFAPLRRTNLSLSGGNEKVKYYLSIGELYQGDVFKIGTRQTKQYNFRSNVDAKVTDYFTVGLNLAGSDENDHYPHQDTGYLYSHIYLYHPTWTPYWPGTNYLFPGRDSENIINFLTDDVGTIDRDYKKLEASMFYKLDIPWIKGLSIDGSLNFDVGYVFYKDWYLPTYVYYKNDDGSYTRGLAGSSPGKASLTESFDQTRRLTLNSKINYVRSFNNHNINLMLGYEQVQGNYNYLSGYRGNYVSTEIPQLFAGSSNKNDQDNSGTATETARQNYFGRATYDYAGKYLAQFIFRYDGSTNFPSDKRFGFFPGVSLGWRISKESFMSQLGFIDNLKIRGSYGEMGNDRINAFQYLTSYAYGNNYVIGNNDVAGLVQSGVPNPAITWEVAKTTNIGFESTLWKGLLGIEFDLFKTRRSNILTKRSAIVPNYTGLLLPDENIGIVKNKGFELQLSHHNTSHEVKYSLSGNISYARNKVIFADEQPGAEEYQKATGRPIGSYLRYNAIGIFSTTEEVNNYPHLAGAQAGDIIYEDVNKDDVINSNDQIRINETITPEIVYSFTGSVSYKNFDLSVLFQGQENAKASFNTYFNALSYSLGNFLQWRADDHWSPDHTQATQPRASQAIWNNNTYPYYSTHWLFDAGFLRLKNLEVGYTIPKRICERIKMQNVRLYVSGNNLLILYDHMKDMGFDPETSSYWYYPQQRIFNMGLNITF